MSENLCPKYTIEIIKIQDELSLPRSTENGVEIIIPFTGKGELFYCRPSVMPMLDSYYDISDVIINIDEKQIIFQIIEIKSPSGTISNDLTKTKTEFIKDIRKTIENMQKDIESFNNNLPTFIREESNKRINNLRLKEQIIDDLMK